MTPSSFPKAKSFYSTQSGSNALVHRSALLLPRWQRLPLLHSPRDRDHRLRPLAQPMAHLENADSGPSPQCARRITYAGLRDVALAFVLAADRRFAA